MLITKVTGLSFRHRLKTACLSGFTLIEVLITIVVIAISATAIMSVFISTAKTSADPIIQQQSVSIAEAYLEEILGKRFADPTGVESGETRATFDDVDDYDVVNDSGARDQNGSPIAGLENYTITVDVTNQAFNGILAVDVRRIDVEVTHPLAGTILLTGFRVNH